jgi:dihydrofolate reductase
MRKLTIIEHISLDGVIQSPGGPDEDRDDGFEHGGWAAPYEDALIGEAIVAAHGKAFDLLLGRRTYDIWSAYWPDAASSPMADSLNAATKYVATHRPDSLGWGPVEDLGADLVEGVRRIKSARGADLILWGSSTLVPILLARGLADEVLLLVFPVLIGTGKRFFPGGAEPRELALVGSKATSSGVLINTYRPAGSLRTGLIADISKRPDKQTAGGST